MASNPLSPCSEIVTHSSVVVSERGKTVAFLNADQKEFCRLRVDGCAIKVGPRADYVVSKVGSISVVIELKGSDVGHAVDQLFATVANEAIAEYLEVRQRLLIVCAEYPSFDTKIAKAQVRARKGGMTLKVVCKSFECDIEQI